MSDPLERLLSDAGVTDRRSIAAALENLIEIDRSTGDVIRRSSFSSLGLREQVIAYLLAKKAASLLNIILTDLVAGDHLATVTGHAPDSLKAAAADLRMQECLSVADNEMYYVAPRNSFPVPSPFLGAVENDHRPRNPRSPRR